MCNAVSQARRKAEARGRPGVVAMAHQKPEESGHDGLSSMEAHGGGMPSSSALLSEEDNDDSAKKAPSVTSCLLPARSLRSTASCHAVHVAQAQPADEDEKKAAALASASGYNRSLSFSKLFSFRMARAASSSLSTLDYADHLDSAAANSTPTADNKEEKLQMSRSQSVPASARRFNSRGGGLRRVADSSSIGADGGVFRLSVVRTPEASTTGEGEEDGDDAATDIGVEEAVCRICMVALSEEAVLKLECCCKGELALAHRDCAIKWFSIKGNGTCDVCSQEVLNLPVTLRRLHSTQAAAAAVAAQTTQQQQPDPSTTTTTSASSRRRRFRMWHGTPILVIISMLAYFCFLEQLLVGDHGTAALAISLPFACVLGLFSSLTTTKMVSRKYVWIYSAVQFLFIVLFTHIFYRYVRMQAVIAIILSTFAGFSVAICANSALLQIIRWRARRAASLTTTGDLEGQQNGHRETPAADPQIALPALP
ncbi:hypothetical protein ACP4OV_021749 [Aristida adscensionis]